MKIFIKLLLLSIIVCSCEHKLKVTERLFVLPNDRFPYWAFDDTITGPLKEKFQTGYVENFSINGATCRFLKNFKQAGMYDLQILKDHTWITNLTLAMPQRTDKFFLKYDFDVDGFYDLLFPEYVNNVIYFFNKDAHQFDKIPVKFGYDYVFLDSSKLIYGTNTQTIKPRTWNIDIFSIAGRIKKPLMKATMYLRYNTNNASFAITNALIYKCNNGIATDTILIDELNINQQRTDFSLSDFMRSLAHNKKYN